MKLKVLMASLMAMFFCLPSFGADNECKKKCTKQVQTCLNDMVRELKTTGFIGVELEYTGVEGELVVTKVIEGSPAEKAGIQISDVLYGINGMKFGQKNDEAISKVKVPGNTVTCNVKRNGTDREFKVTLVPMPADMVAKYIGEHMMEHAQTAANLSNR